MNKERRKKIQAIISRIEQLRDDAIEIQDEEQESLDNLPESLQDSEQAERMESSILGIEEAVECLVNAVDELEGVCDG